MTLPAGIGIIDPMIGFPVTDFKMLAVKLMLKWPIPYYPTPAFAPTHCSRVVIDFASTRDAVKIYCAGYFSNGPEPHIPNYRRKSA